MQVYIYSTGVIHDVCYIFIQQQATYGEEQLFFFRAFRGMLRQCFRSQYVILAYALIVPPVQHPVGFPQINIAVSRPDNKIY
jgi:hypothetical protein